MIEVTLLFNVLRLFLSDRLAIRYALGITLVFGISMEVAQRWIPGRGATWIDVIATVAGVSVFVLYCHHVQKS